MKCSCNACRFDEPRNDSPFKANYNSAYLVRGFFLEGEGYSVFDLNLVYIII